MISLLAQDAIKLIQRVNDNYVASLFTAAEVSGDVSRFGTIARDLPVFEAYHHNQYATRLAFPLSELANNLRSAQEFTSLTYFVFIQAAIESFVRDAIELVERLQPPLAPSGFSETDLRRLSNSFGLTPAMWLGAELSTTFDYFRVRRNCIIHADGTPNQQFQTMTTNNGTTLSGYWDARLTSGARSPRLGIDFMSHNPGVFFDAVVLDCLRISRILVRELDERISARFFTDLSRECAATYRAVTPNQTPDRPDLFQMAIRRYVEQTLRMTPAEAATLTAIVL